MTDAASPHERHFKRRQKAALERVHLPTEEDLLRGMPFFGNELGEDIREYASRLGRRVRKRKSAALAPLAEALYALTVDQSEDAVQALVAPLDSLGEPKGLPVDACRLRCRIYLACFGSAGAAAAVAGEIAGLALVDIRTGKGPGLLWHALSCAAYARELERSERDGVTRSVTKGVQFQHDFGSYESRFKAAILNPRADEPKAQESPPGDLAIPDLEEEEEESATGETKTPDDVIVFSAVGNDTTPDGKRVTKEFETVRRRPLPLPVTPDLAAVRTTLADEFPRMRCRSFTRCSSG